MLGNRGDESYEQAAMMGADGNCKQAASMGRGKIISRTTSDNCAGWLCITPPEFLLLFEASACEGMSDCFATWTRPRADTRKA